MQSDWSRAFSIRTQEQDFSQARGFHASQKAFMVHHLKPKNLIDGPVFLFKICIADLFQSIFSMLD